MNDDSTLRKSTPAFSMPDRMCGEGPTGRMHSFQMKRLRLYWFTVAARVIRSGHRVTLALARGPTAALRFERAQLAIAHI